MRRDLFLLTIASVVLTLSSCKKVWDYVKDHPNGTADNCQIDKIYFTQNYVNPYGPPCLSDTCADIYVPTPFNDTANFKYNSKGQLTSIDYASSAHLLTVDAYPVFNFIFLYDELGRLSAFFERVETLNNNNLSALYAHKYNYKSDHEIIDSTWDYTFSTLYDNGVIINGSSLNISSIKLDDYGRIVKDKNGSYNYDASGNLIKPGVTYTSKKSILQTNKTLMFINRDYSINTRVGYAYQFNTNQLPTKFNTGKLPFFTEYYPNGNDNQNIRVEYLCK